MNTQPQRISAKEARDNFTDLLGRVYYGNEAIVVERKGRPFAVVISPQQYKVLRRDIDEFWTTVEKVQTRNADKTEEEVLADVTAEVEAVRKEMYEKKSRQNPRRR